jgi:transposase-like protein
MMYLWRAVDAEGEILDVLVQSKRDKRAALKLMRKRLKKYAVVPERLITDDLRSYGSAARDLGGWSGIARRRSKIGLMTRCAVQHPIPARHRTRPRDDGGGP